ncbi:MAG: M16 family metallopeptidase [Leucothrix sp.]
MKIYAYWVVLALTTLLTGCLSSDQYKLNETVLPNGLKTTIIQNKNSHSSNEVDLRLLIKAGSLQENDNELGYAHFVEHMAFNGTKDFPKNKLIAALNELGIRFGSHANAFTHFDHTEFQIKLDTNDAARLAKAVGILKQWAAHITFDPKEVKAEIPVIAQEWKLSKPTEERASFKIQEAIYKGSRFANRLPIGTLQSIQAATPEKLRAFYERWYHPQNTQLIISGDIDTDTVNKLISAQFSDWKQRPDASTPTVNDLNLDAVPEHASVTDPNMLGSEVVLAFAAPTKRPQTQQQREQTLPWQIGIEALRQRLQKRLIATQGKVVKAFTQWSQPSPNIRHFGMTAVLSNNDYQAGMNLLSSELAHLKENGISQQELDDIKNATLKRESSQQDTSYHLANVAKQNALYGWPIINQKAWHKALEAFLPKVTTDQVNAAVNQIFSSTPHIIISRNASFSEPDIAQLKHILSNPKPVQATVKTETGGDIWAIQPALKGTITSENEHRTGADEWKLSNGITVFYKHNDSNSGKTYFELSTKGGLNLFEAPEVFQARLALPVMQISGLRQMDAQSLDQWISSKGMMLYPKMGFSQRGFHGHTPSDDLQTLMQILYVALTEARASDDASAHVFHQNKTLISQIQEHKTYKGQQQIERELLLSDPALRTITIDELDVITSAQMQSIYDKYIANAQEYRLAIVGDISAADAKAAVLATVANLPKNHPETNTRNYPSPAKPVNFEYSGNGRRNAGVSLKWLLPRTVLKAYTFDGFRVLSELIEESLISNIREELGLVYSIKVTSAGDAYDSTTWELAIDFACDIDKRQTVSKAIQSTLDEMAKAPIPQSKIDGLIQSMRDDRRQRFKPAKMQAKWLALNNIYGGPNDPHTLDVDSRFQGITSEGLQELLKLFIGKQSTTVAVSSLP